MKNFTLITKEGEITVDGNFTVLGQGVGYLEVLVTFPRDNYNLPSLKAIAENSNNVVPLMEMNIDGTLYSVLGMGSVEDTKTEICFYLTNNVVPEVIYKRKVRCTLSKVTIDKEKNIVKGTNDIGSPVIMTVKQFEDLYE